MTFYKGHNSAKRDNSDLINTYQLCFDEESICEISKLYLNKFCNGRTHGQAESNMPFQLFQSWGHNIFTHRSGAVLLLWIICVIYVLSLLFIAALWSPAVKGLTSWPLFVMFNCVFGTLTCSILSQV